jgi:hypothetical protein
MWKLKGDESLEKCWVWGNYDLLCLPDDRRYL